MSKYAPQQHILCSVRLGECKHTRNNCTALRTVPYRFFTAGERAKAAVVWGTQRRRLGQDSQRAFDSCNLCLSPLATDCVAAPSGALYCRECIYTNLLAQREALNEAKAAYEADQARIAAETRAAEGAAAEAQLDAFRRQETGQASQGFRRDGAGLISAVHVASQALVAYSGNKSSGDAVASHVASEVAAIATLRARVDTRTDEEKRSQVLAASFWVPAASSSAESAVPKADAAPRDPATGEFLRAKQLVTVRLTQNTEAVEKGEDASSNAAVGGGGSSRVARFMCPACYKPIVFQKTFALRACGHVVCDTCLARFVTPTQRCVVCNASVSSKNGTLALQQGGSSFVGNAGTQVEASRAGPALG